ncbi:MAG: DUF1853 family protein [Burkholderiales bacterium]|nr:DUF1853 family protein [Burkholderiales bacterium]
MHALAWLLAAPDLLDRHASVWQSKIAQLADVNVVTPTSAQLLALAPSLQQAMQAEPQTRIGRYAEKLLAFYFQQQGVLHAQGLQVRVAAASEEVEAGDAAKGVQTLGEFDFLLQPTGKPSAGLWHWEFATKFYLYAPSLLPRAASDYFIGPNLADSLGAKMHKILQKQLALGQYAQLPYAIVRAQALIKGWMFYPFQDAADGADSAAISLAESASGLAPDHCRGFWCSQAQLPRLMQCLQLEHLTNLARLRWLAPALVASGSPQVQDLAQAQEYLVQYFQQQTMPVLWALLRFDDGHWCEAARVFVVPDDWLSRAQQANIPQMPPAFQLNKE